MSTHLPSLDLILGGGIPKGRIMEIFGVEGSSKITLALYILAQCQRDGKRVAYTIYIDSNEKLKELLFGGISLIRSLFFIFGWLVIILLFFVIENNKENTIKYTKKICDICDNKIRFDENLIHYSGFKIKKNENEEVMCLKDYCERCKGKLIKNKV